MTMTPADEEVLAERAEAKRRLAEDENVRAQVVHAVSMMRRRLELQADPRGLNDSMGHALSVQSLSDLLFGPDRDQQEVNSAARIILGVPESSPILLSNPAHFTAIAKARAVLAAIRSVSQ